MQQYFSPLSHTELKLNQRRRIFPALVVFLVVAGSLFAFDQALKRWCNTELRIFERREIVAGAKQLVLSRVLNRGIAGDHFSNVPEGHIEPYTRYIPTAVWFAMLLLAGVRFRKAKAFERVALAAVLAGGASNLFDHWRSEYVTDTLQLCVFGEQCLPFNIADAAIVLGGIAVVICFIRLYFKPVRLFA